MEYYSTIKENNEARVHATQMKLPNPILDERARNKWGNAMKPFV